MYTLSIQKETELHLPFSKISTQENISQSLKKIYLLIKCYEKYLSLYNSHIGKKYLKLSCFSCVFFTSLFISHIRKSINNNEARQNIPLFIFIGGTEGLGNISLLKSIVKMIKNNNLIKNYIIL